MTCDVYDFLNGCLGKKRETTMLIQLSTAKWAIEAQNQLRADSAPTPAE